MKDLLQVGMKCYTKKVNIFVGNTNIEMSAPRGKQYAVILMTVEDPKEINKVTPDEFLKKLGWEFKE